MVTSEIGRIVLPWKYWAYLPTVSISYSSGSFTFGLQRTEADDPGEAEGVGLMVMFFSVLRATSILLESWEREVSREGQLVPNGVTGVKHWSLAWEDLTCCLTHSLVAESLKRHWDLWLVPGSAKLMILLPEVLTAGLVGLGFDDDLLSIILTGWTALFIAVVCLDKPSIVAEATRGGMIFMR